MTRLPVEWVRTGYGVPDICARHGEPATRRSRVQFISRPPGWSYPLALLGVVVFLIVLLATRKSVIAEKWPYCRTCRSQARVRLIGGTLVVLASFLLFIVGLSMNSETGNVLGVWLALASFVAMIAGLFVAARGVRPVIAGGTVTRDGYWLEVRKADSRFSAIVDAAVAQATQQQAAYQAAQAAAHQQASSHYTAQQQGGFR